MRPDTPWLTGSITKVWTTALTMTLVDEGVLALDTPVVELLPEFRLADDEAAGTVTVRHLLNHTSGIDAGDLLLDLGAGTSGFRAFVERLKDVRQVHPVGQYASYNNAGWVVLALAIEAATSATYDDLMRDCIIEPLGLTRTTNDVREAVLWGPAVGSSGRPGAWVGGGRMFLPLTFAPAGATLFTNVHDTLSFLDMQLNHGASQGRRILSEAAVTAMCTRTADHPTGPQSGYALGWGVMETASGTLLHHGGGSVGGQAYAGVLGGLTFAGYSNAPTGMAALREVAERTLGVALQAPPLRPADGEVDLSPMLGRYERAGVVTTVEGADDGVSVTIQPHSIDVGDPAGLAPLTFSMVPAGPSALIDPVSGATVHLVELGPDGYQLLYASGRLSRRTDS
jgi:CubicO group peptidase (beta-lactamase class C family)